MVNISQLGKGSLGMDHQLQEKKSGDDVGKAVMQLLQIKYILAGMLALAVFGHTGD